MIGDEVDTEPLPPVAATVYVPSVEVVIVTFDPAVNPIVEVVMNEEPLARNVTELPPSIVIVSGDVEVETPEPARMIVEPVNPPMFAIPPPDPCAVQTIVPVEEILATWSEPPHA